MRRRTIGISVLALALAALIAALGFQLSGPGEAIGPDALVGIAPRAERERAAGTAAAIDAVPESVVGERAELSVLVRDEEGADLQGAALIASANGGDVDLGATDANGRLRATLPAAHGPRVRAVLAGFRTAVLALPPEPVDPLLIVLERVRRVEGRVLRIDGSPAGEGLLVIAWVRERGTPAPARVAWAMQRERAVLQNLWTVRTDARGAFAFDDLPAGEMLCLDAGGRGLLATDMGGDGQFARESIVLTPESESAVELRVRRGFAVQLVLEESHGQPTRYDGAQPPATWSYRFPGAGMTDCLRPGAIAAGLEPTLAEPHADRWIVLVHADTEEERVGPVHVRIELPGHAAVEGQVEAETLERPTPLVRIALECLASGFGELRLNWIGAPLELADFAPRLYGAGVVELQPLEGGSPHRYDVEPGHDLRAALAFIPAGTFLASFRLGRQRSATGPSEGEPTRVTIGAEPAYLTIDLSRTSTGFLLLDVLDEEGGPWDGRLRGKVSCRRQGQVLASLEPPYLIAGLLPGEHKLILKASDVSLQASTPGPLRAVVEPGAVTRLHLVATAR